MLEICRAGPGPVSLSVEKTKNFDQVRPPRSCWPKWTKGLIGLFSPYLMPRVGGLPYKLEICRAGPGPVNLSIEKTKNFDQVRPPRSCWPKWTKFLIGLFSSYLMPLE